MRSRQLLGAMTAALLFTLSGCVAYDSSISRQHPASAGSTRIHGQFSCRPSYRSNELGFVGPPSLAEVFGRSECQMATLDYSEQFGLMVSLEHRGVYDELIAIDRQSGLRTTQEGKIILSRKSECTAGEGAVACIKKSVTLFVNVDGDLVVVDDGVSGGLIAVVPVAISGHLMAIFPHWDG